MESAADFDFFEDRYPKRTRKPINKPELIDELEDDVLFQKQKLMSHCVYDIQEIVASDEFKDDLILKKTDVLGFNVEYIRQHGLSTPTLFTVPAEKLGMIVPDAETFTVFDVLELAGKERKIEVVEVNEQKGRTMKLADFIEYYTCSSEFRRELLNVLSLEFSMTNLEKLVKPPAFVSEIDWIDNIWPKELFERQKIHMKTNHCSDYSTYPKVQRYCLMSVANCFTDFHIDFGGTSVWYHVLKGRKIFWLVEPTEENLVLYEEWIMGGNNSESFFGRIVNKCNRVELLPGMTFVIPSGWIHCVFTPEDSLVFGGNFLHSYAISMQVRVVKSEDKIKVGGKYRFPHFKQMIWYVIESIVRKATGRIYLKPIKPKAYLADLHHFDVQVTLPEEVDDAELTDDQEPCCSSAVEAGCKKSGLHKADIGLNGMGIEDSESDSDDDFLLGDNTNNPDICYDDMPNGADNCYMLVPTQMKYAAKNNEAFMPVINYNEEYLSSIPSIEVNGYFSLLEYAKKLIKTRKPEVGEGITRPKHLLMEFEYLLYHLSKAGQFNITKDIDLKGRSCDISNREQTRELIVKLKVFDSVSANFKEPSKKRKKRKLVKTEDLKKAIKIGKHTKRATDQPPILVDGLPHPLQSADPPAPNPYDYNPLEAVVALGQKPLPSAYRQSSNMAQIPPTQRFRLKRKDESLDESRTSNKSDEYNLNDSTASSNKSIRSDVKSALSHNNSHHQLTMHCDDPELAYKSPLQRLQEEKQKKLQEQKQQKFLEEQQRRFNEERQRKAQEDQQRRVEAEKQHLLQEQRKRKLMEEELKKQTTASTTFGHNAETGTSSVVGNTFGNDGFKNSDNWSDESEFSSYKNGGSSNSYHGSRFQQFPKRNDYRKDSGGFESNKFMNSLWSNNDRGGRFNDHRRFTGGHRKGGYNNFDRGNNAGSNYYRNDNTNNYYRRDRWNKSGNYSNCAETGTSSVVDKKFANDSFGNSNNWSGESEFSNYKNGGNNSNDYRGGRFQQFPKPDDYRKDSGGFESNKFMNPVGTNNDRGGRYRGVVNRSDGYGGESSSSTTQNDHQRFTGGHGRGGYNNFHHRDDNRFDNNGGYYKNDRANNYPRYNDWNNRGNYNNRGYSFERPAEVSLSTASVNSFSPQPVTIDGFEGINEIGRLTKMMGEDNEDVDLRDPAFFANSSKVEKSSLPVISSFYKTNSEHQSANLPKASGQVTMTNASSSDPSTDIDEIFRISQMYEP